VIARLDTVRERSIESVARLVPRERCGSSARDDPENSQVEKESKIRRSHRLQPAADPKTTAKYKLKLLRIRVEPSSALV
jgi:hypothetical protein